MDARFPVADTLWIAWTGFRNDSTLGKIRNAMQPDNNTGCKLEEISARKWTRSPACVRILFASVSLSTR